MRHFPICLALLFQTLLPGRCSEERGAAEAFGGPEVLEIVREADKVVAYRIESDPLTFRKTGEYKIVGDPVTLGEREGEDFIATMTNPKIYEWGMAKACLPQPGLLFRFHRGSDIVDTLICLECDVFMISSKGKLVGGQNCDAASAALLDLAVSLFPNDVNFLNLEKERETEAERQKKRDGLVSPTDGAKLLYLASLGQGDVLKSMSDGTIWLYREDEGVFRPDPNNKDLQQAIAILLKHQD